MAIIKKPLDFTLYSKPDVHPSPQKPRKKKKRQAIKCLGCGAVTKKKVCEYCGTPYGQ